MLQIICVSQTQCKCSVLYSIKQTFVGQILMKKPLHLHNYLNMSDFCYRKNICVSQTHFSNFVYLRTDR